MKKIIKIYYELDAEDLKSIKKQMIDLNLNITKIAKNLGVSKSYLSGAIHGDRHFTTKIKEQFESQGIVFEKPEN